MNNNTIKQLWTLFSGNPTAYVLACGLYSSFYCSTNVFVIIHPPWRRPDKEEGCQKEMLISPHILPKLLLYYCQWKIRVFKTALAEEQRKSEVATDGEP